MPFREEYQQYREPPFRVCDSTSIRTPVSEHVVQCIWYDQLFSSQGLQTTDGHFLKVLSPGWWNHGEGPDFSGAQIAFDGKLRTGDVEVHIGNTAWRQHGHQADPRYNDVMLEVLLEGSPAMIPPVTASGRTVPVLVLSDFLEEEAGQIADRLTVDDYPYRTEAIVGQCSGLAGHFGTEFVTNLIGLAGEWRIVSKARQMRERMDRVGAEQALYEAFLTACGYAPFKHHFRMLAQQFHYDRARQLGRQDPFLLEAALLQLAGLLPDNEHVAPRPPHLDRLLGLKRERFATLRPLSLTWHRVGVRPTNYPERRLAGAAMVLARTAREGLLETLETLWQEEETPVKRRKAFESIFPTATMGFWGNHCTWTGKAMARPSSPLGPDRIRSIIGNVFVPAALAMARQARNRSQEEKVLRFFAALPCEANNHILKTMVPRILGDSVGIAIDFRLQQGLLQIYQDWCATNPSCHECAVRRFLVPPQFPQNIP